MFRTIMMSMGTLAWALVWASPAPAEPLKFESIPASAKWIAHLDADAARASKVMSAFLKDCVLPNYRADYAKVSHVSPCSAVDLSRLQSVTLYGSQLGQRTCVAIVRGQWNKEEFLEKLEKSVDVQQGMTKGQRSYTWTKGKGTDMAHEVTLAFPQDEVMVFASGTDELSRALDLLAGEGANLASADSLLAKAPPQGTILLLRAAGLTSDDIGEHLRVFRNLQGFEYTAAERGDHWREHVSVTAGTESVAKKVARGLDGLVATMSLLFQDQPQLMALVDQVQIKRDGTLTQLHFESNAADVAKLVGPACAALQEEFQLRSNRMLWLLGDQTTPPRASAKKQP